MGILVQSLGEVGHYVKPKNRSGLGVQTARDMNVSLLGKHVWSMLHERNKLWVELLSKKSTIPHDKKNMKIQKKSPYYKDYSKCLEIQG